MNLTHLLTYATNPTEMSLMANTMRWRYGDTSPVMLAGLVAITLFPVALTVFAWDTTRVGGFGWLGVAIALGMFLKESARLPRVWQQAVVVLAAVNLLIPSYNVVIFYRDSLSAYPYRGVYMMLDSIIRQIPL